MHLNNVSFLYFGQVDKNGPVRFFLLFVSTFGYNPESPTISEGILKVCLKGLGFCTMNTKMEVHIHIPFSFKFKSNPNAGLR